MPKIEGEEISELERTKEWSGEKGGLETSETCLCQERDSNTHLSRVRGTLDSKTVLSKVAA